MLTFAYTVLVLLLAAVGVWYLLRTQKREADTQFSNYKRDQRRRIRSLREKDVEQQSQIMELSNRIEILSQKSDRDQGIVRAPINQFTKSEQRTIDEMKKVTDIKAA